jgi:hypothetical protein
MLWFGGDKRVVTGEVLEKIQALILVVRNV